MAAAAWAQPGTGHAPHAAADGRLRGHDGRGGNRGADEQAARAGARGVSDIAQVEIDESQGDVVVARLSGEVDLSNAGAVGEELAAAVPNRALGLVLDLAGTRYLDSSGVSLVFDLGERLRRRQQQLRLVAPDGAPLRRVLRIVDPSGALPLVETVDGAVAEIRTSA